MADGEHAGGPGRAGGLLFVGVVLFLAYLALTGEKGAWWGGALAAVLVAAALVLGARVMRRR